MDVQLPKFGTKDNFSYESLKMFPCVGNDEDISIKDLYNLLKDWAQDEGLSEQGLKRALLCRLRGARAKSWLRYQKYPLRDAITSMICLYDRQESIIKYSNIIKTFSRRAGEDIQQSVERLLSAINKYLESRSPDEAKIIRKEILISKLPILLSSRGYQELERKMEEKRQIGVELDEKSIIQFIYTENIFDQRNADKTYLQLNNVEDDKINSLSDDFSRLSLDLNAIEHKRSIGPHGNIHDFKQAKTKQNPRLDSERKILSATRQFEPTASAYGGNDSKFINDRENRPILVGRDNKPYVKVGRPNSENIWSSRLKDRNQGYNQQFNKMGNQPIRPNFDQSRQNRSDFIASRNAPLNFKDRRDSTDFNNMNGTNFRQSNFSNERRNSYPRYDYRRQNSYRGDQSRQIRPNYSQPGLRHNMQIRSNPPAIFQQISYDQLNSLCISEECRGDRRHSVAECTKTQVFRKAPIQRGRN